MRLLILSICCAAACFTLTNCENLLVGKTEGVIEYEITYPEIDSNNAITELLPNQMHLYFKGDQMKWEMASGMGMFRTTVLADHKTKNLKQLVKVFVSKTFCDLDANGVSDMLAMEEHVTIEETGETIDWNGITANKAIAHVTESGASFPIIHTDAFSMKSPNWFTPYHEIPGALLDFEIDQHGLRMRMKAVDFKPIEILPEEFVADEGYELISYDQMKAQLSQLVEDSK